MTKDKLNIISADELLDTTYAPSGCLIERLMGRGIYILAGAPKVGKSWLVLWLADKISKGESVWNLKTEQGGVLYISLEDTYQRIQKRLNDVSGSKPGNIWFATEAEYIGCGFEVQLLNFLNEHTEVKLVIIDTLQRIRQVGSEQYNYASDYEAMCALKQIADSRSITILVVHHTRKTGSADSFNMISGTTGLLGCADGAMVLLKDKREDNHATLHVTGRETPDIELNLTFNRETKIWEFAGFNTPEAPARVLDPILLAVQTFMQDKDEWKGYASALLDALKAQSNIDGEANILTRTLNANVAELEQDFSILYRSGTRTAKGRPVLLRKVHKPEPPAPEAPASVDNVGNVDILRPTPLLKISTLSTLPPPAADAEAEVCA